MFIKEIQKHLKTKKALKLANTFKNSQFNTLLQGQIECVKVPMPACQNLPLTGYIFEVSYSMSVTQFNRVRVKENIEIYEEALEHYQIQKKEICSAQQNFGH